jgi:hypothetical protein
MSDKRSIDTPARSIPDPAGPPSPAAAGGPVPGWVSGVDATLVDSTGLARLISLLEGALGISAVESEDEAEAPGPQPLPQAETPL